MTTLVVDPATMRRTSTDATAGLDRIRGRIADVRTVAVSVPPTAHLRDLMVALDGLLATVRRRWATPADLADAVDRLDRQHRDLLDRHLADRLDRPAMLRPRVDPVVQRLRGADDPAAVAATWATLSPAQQVQLAVDRPRWLSHLDGIPLAVRDRINRVAVRAELAHVVARSGGPRAPGGGEGVHLRDRDRRRAAALRAMLAADRVLAFDPIGDGRAVVAVGDPSHAEHVATIVPGIGTELSDVPGLLDQARSVRTASVATGPAIRAADVAAIAWLGYDSPPGPVDIAVDLADLQPSTLVLAATSLVADHHARDLQAHAAGVRAVNPDAHHVVLGHSYGSVLALRALRAEHGRERLDVDAVVALGSPGAGRDVDDATDLPHDVPVWSALAPTDPVRLLPVLGPAPTSVGAQPLPVGPGNLGHVRYLAAGTVGLAAVAQVVVGRHGCPVPDRTTSRPGR